jgi:hypothetical protein
MISKPDPSSTGIAGTSETLSPQNFHDFRFQCFINKLVATILNVFVNLALERHAAPRLAASEVQIKGELIDAVDFHASLLVLNNSDG